MMNSTTDAVHAQYEELPYPARNPADEQTRLITTVTEPLAKMNHFCFRGRESFSRNFRALCAGCGTGDAAIYLAWQLRATNAEIVALDFSSASLAIAKARAEIRGLKNIRWVQASLLDLPQLDLGQFDYINSIGVLHHLPNPAAGLRALTSVLHDDGALALMVYAHYGRTAIYQVQELLRLLHTEKSPTTERLRQARALLQSLPADHWYWLWAGDDPEHLANQSDTELFDRLLHACDRAYTVPQLYEFLQSADLHLIEFVGEGAESATYYDPAKYLTDPELLRTVRAQPRATQHAIAELLYGRHLRHAFYASRRRDTVMMFANDGVVLVPAGPLETMGALLADSARNSTDANLHISTTAGSITLPREPAYIAWLAHLDGKKNARDLVTHALIASQLADTSEQRTRFTEQLRDVFVECHKLGWMYLRAHSSA